VLLEISFACTISINPGRSVSGPSLGQQRQTSFVIDHPIVRDRESWLLHCIVPGPKYIQKHLQNILQCQESSRHEAASSQTSPLQAYLRKTTRTKSSRTSTTTYPHQQSSRNATISQYTMPRALQSPSAACIKTKERASKGTMRR